MQIDEVCLEAVGEGEAEEEGDVEEGEEAEEGLGAGGRVSGLALRAGRPRGWARGRNGGGDGGRRDARRWVRGE